MGLPEGKLQGDCGEEKNGEKRLGARAARWVAGISGRSRGDHPSSEAAVDFEVGVGGEKEWIGQNLREAD